MFINQNFFLVDFSWKNLRANLSQSHMKRQALPVVVLSRNIKPDKFSSALQAFKLLCVKYKSLLDKILYVFYFLILAHA